jgi:flagellar basal-body rod protein FlgB
MESPLLLCDARHASSPSMAVNQGLALVTGTLIADTGSAERPNGKPRMIGALFNQPNYLAMKKMMDLTALRQEAIASNLANIETPGYQRIDVAPSFVRELQQALAGKSADQIGHMTPRLETDLTAKPRTRDGNTVQLEQELVTMFQNGVEHQVQAQLITGSLLKMRQAITGRQV